MRSQKQKQQGKGALSKPDIPKPIVFIGSSKEGEKIAQAIHSNLENDTTPSLWSQGVFELSNSFLESLLKFECDFAVLVLSPDDKQVKRKRARPSPRDNIIFELGLFMGKLGKGKTYFVIPKGTELHLPTDLLGITCGYYDPARPDNNLRAGVLTATNEILEAVKRNSPSFVYDASLRDRLHQLEQRHAKYLRTLLRSVPIPDELGIQKPLEKLSLYDLRDICRHLKIKTGSTLLFNSIEIGAHWEGGVGAPANQLQRKIFETKLDEMERILTALESNPQNVK